MADALKEAVERLSKMAGMTTVDPTPLDPYGRCLATFADLRTILTELSRLEGESETLAAGNAGRQAVIRAQTTVMRGLRRQIAERDEALKPFAAVSAKAKGADDACWCGQDGAVIRYRDLRAAERALTSETTHAE